MASNEEILKQAIPNFDNKDLPKFRVVFSRDFSDNVSQKILSSMDTARKDEAVGFAEFISLNEFSSFLKDGIIFWYREGDLYKYTTKELYTIFKQQNS